jgi:hypothetical protein
MNYVLADLIIVAQTSWQYLVAALPRVTTPASIVIRLPEDLPLLIVQQ